MPFPFPTAGRRGAALLIVLAAVMLVGSLVAAGGVRRYSLLADQRRLDAKARLRIALWDAVWSDLRLAASQPASGLPSGGRHEAPDGVQTAVQVQPAEKAGRKEPSRFYLTATAALGKDRHEAWALAQRTGDGYRILTWVER
jgi:hypothetical protein